MKRMLSLKREYWLSQIAYVDNLYKLKTYTKPFEINSSIKTDIEILIVEAYQPLINLKCICS